MQTFLILLKFNDKVNFTCTVKICLYSHGETAKTRAGAGLVHITPEKFEKVVFTLKIRQMFPFTLRERSFKTQQSPVILDLCLRKTNPAGKSRGYRDVIVLEKLDF